MLAERIELYFGFKEGDSGMMNSQAMMILMAVIAKWDENFLSKVKAGGVSFLPVERDDMTGTIWCAFNYRNFYQTSSSKSLL